MSTIRPPIRAKYGIDRRVDATDPVPPADESWKEGSQNDGPLTPRSGGREEGPDRHDRSQGGVQMRVVVDLNRCLSYGQCIYAAPTVFWWHGEEALEYDHTPDDTLRLQVERAAAACPR